MGGAAHQSHKITWDDNKMITQKVLERLLYRYLS